MTRKEKLNQLVHEYEKLLFEEDESSFHDGKLEEAENALSKFLKQEAEEFNKKLNALCDEFHGAQIVHDVEMMIYFADCDTRRYSPSFVMQNEDGRTSPYQIPTYEFDIALKRD